VNTQTVRHLFAKNGGNKRKKPANNGELKNKKACKSLTYRLDEQCSVREMRLPAAISIGGGYKRSWPSRFAVGFFIFSA
jgi:hypothetical protein